MKHPKRFCVPCGKEQLLTIRRGTTYNMYHCQECGDEVGRVGDGDSQHAKLSISGLDVRSISEEAMEGTDILGLALGNPDILSDEHTLWQQRNPDEEAAREDRLRTFKVSLSGLTSRQAQVLGAVREYETHEAAALYLGITRQVVTKTMKDIEKKLSKTGCIFHKQGLKGKGTL